MGWKIAEEVRRLPMRDIGDDEVADIFDDRFERLGLFGRSRWELLVDLTGFYLRLYGVCLNVFHVFGNQLDEFMPLSSKRVGTGRVGRFADGAGHCMSLTAPPRGHQPRRSIDFRHSIISITYEFSF